MLATLLALGGACLEVLKKINLLPEEDWSLGFLNSFWEDEFLM